MIPIRLIRLLDDRKRHLEIIHPTVRTNARNDKVRDYDQPAGRDIPKWSVTVDGASQEIWGDREMTEVTYTALMAPRTPVDEHDQIRVDGVPFRIEGKPLQIQSPTGRLDHIAVALTEWRS